ncbi:MAG: flagellar export chaperone FliS [candidate division Zixibacteria bacterium]|nr:flagellar export chaperone FliS [candidate division Zixibacteria bacterium]
MQKDIEKYKEMQVAGLKQKDLIVMLYGGAIRYLKEAKKHIKNNNVSGWQTSFEKARKIILHLYSTLNTKEGGIIAEKLQSLYAYIVEQICAANALKDTKLVDQIIPLLDTIKEGWEKIDAQDKSVPKTIKGIPTNNVPQLSVKV